MHLCCNIGQDWKLKKKREIKIMSSNFTSGEIAKLQSYLQKKLGNKNLTISQRKEIKDSIEVMIAGEFLGVIYKDEDEGEISYDFNMAILDIDIE